MMSSRWTTLFAAVAAIALLALPACSQESRVALPPGVSHWSLTTLQGKLIKIGAKVVSSARYVTFQMAEVAVPQRLFRAILRRISRLVPPLLEPG
jgi:hypothetical protein